MTHNIEASIESEPSSVLQLQANSLDALPFVIQSTKFQRSSSMIASGFPINHVVGNVVFRALPALNSDCEASICTLDARVAATAPAACTVYRPVHDGLSRSDLVVTVSAVSIASRVLSSLGATQRCGPRFRSLKYSLERSLRRQLLGAFYYSTWCVRSCSCCSRCRCVSYRQLQVGLGPTPGGESVCRHRSSFYEFRCQS